MIVADPRELVPMKRTLAIAVGLLLFSVSVAQATPIHGFFTGFVTYNSDPTPSMPFLEGTPVSGIFGYDTDFLSAPDAFGNRTVEYSPTNDATAFISLEIPAGHPLIGYTTSFGGNTFELVVNAAGLPALGSGNGFFDLSLGPNGLVLYEIDRSGYLQAEVTYRLPDHESTLPLTIVGLAALALARRFL
jgi:hypothetical protein